MEEDDTYVDTSAQSWLESAARLSEVDLWFKTWQDLPCPKARERPAQSIRATCRYVTRSWKQEEWEPGNDTYMVIHGNDHAIADWRIASRSLSSDQEADRIKLKELHDTIEPPKKGVQSKAKLLGAGSWKQKCCKTHQSWNWEKEDNIKTIQDVWQGPRLF